MDKDGGLLLIEDTVIQGKEIELMRSMNARVVEGKTSNQILDDLVEADRTLRLNFNPFEKRYMSKFRSFPRGVVEMPFLKI